MDRSVWILLVEGRRSVHRKVSQQLEGIKFELVTVAGWRSAVERISRQRFDLILMGPEIEHPNRLNLISTVMASYPMPAVLVFIQPGQEHFAVEALRLGASDYIIQDREERYLHLLPMVITNILRRRQLEQEKISMLNTLKQRNLVLTSLNRIGGELTSILEPDRLINRLMRAAIDILNAEGGSLWLWSDDQKNTLVCRAVLHRAGTPPLLGVERHASEGIVGWVSMNNQSTILDRVDRDKRFSREVDQQINFETRMLMAVPLRIRDRAIGVLEFVNKLNGRFDEDDLVVAETLAATAATALENARLVDQLRLHTNDLEERNEELDAFGYTLAHDLQNILARIAGFAELIESEFQSDEIAMSPDQLRRSATLISRNSRKMSTIIDALLLFSSVRDAEVTFSPIQMETIIGEVMERLKERIEEVDSFITLPDQWPTALGYAPWVEEIWYNYLSNALKYGGSPPEIELNASLKSDSKYICFWVSDKGPGVNQEFIHNLFRPYKQHNPANRDGYGLGLSIVARIVKRMGGDVGYKTQPEGGSCFYFTLPVA